MLGRAYQNRPERGAATHWLLPSEGGEADKGVTALPNWRDWILQEPKEV